MKGWKQRMSENATKEQLSMEYAQLASRLGDIEYRGQCLMQEKQEIMHKMGDVNMRASKLSIVSESEFSKSVKEQENG